MQRRLQMRQVVFAKSLMWCTNLTRLVLSPIAPCCFALKGSDIFFSCFVFNLLFFLLNQMHTMTLIPDINVPRGTLARKQMLMLARSHQYVTYIIYIYSHQVAIPCDHFNFGIHHCVSTNPHSIFEPFWAKITFHCCMLLSVNALHTNMHLRYEVFSTELCSLEHSKELLFSVIVLS